MLKLTSAIPNNFEKSLSYKSLAYPNNYQAKSKEKFFFNLINTIFQFFQLISGKNKIEFNFFFF